MAAVIEELVSETSCSVEVEGQASNSVVEEQDVAEIVRLASFFASSNLTTTSQGTSELVAEGTVVDVEVVAATGIVETRKQETKEQEKKEQNEIGIVEDVEVITESVRSTLDSHIISANIFHHLVG